jgi:hypothetical protein
MLATTTGVLYGPSTHEQVKLIKAIQKVIALSLTSLLLLVMLVRKIVSILWPEAVTLIRIKTALKTITTILSPEKVSVTPIKSLLRTISVTSPENVQKDVIGSISHNIAVVSSEIFSTIRQFLPGSIVNKKLILINAPPALDPTHTDPNWTLSGVNNVAKMADTGGNSGYQSYSKKYMRGSFDEGPRPFA